MKQLHTPAWMSQPFWYISTKQPSNKLARIYPGQRETIMQLIADGYEPTETVSGKAPCSKKHWNLLPYEGKHGSGYRMVSAYKHSGLNSITYFIKNQAI